MQQIPQVEIKIIVQKNKNSLLLKKTIDEFKQLSKKVLHKKYIKYYPKLAKSKEFKFILDDLQVIENKETIIFYTKNSKYGINKVDKYFNMSYLDCLVNLDMLVDIKLIRGEIIEYNDCCEKETTKETTKAGKFVWIEKPFKSSQSIV
jgi:hypothetical protein